MMQVELINAEEIKNLFINWGITSSICYGSDGSDFERLGKNCMFSQHFSGSRGDYFKFRVTGVPRFTVDQAVRSSIGVFCNVASFRYIDKGNFSYSIPEEIKDSPRLTEVYKKHMEDTLQLYQTIQWYVKDKTEKQERANEQARYVLPMATETSFVMGFTLEALIHFCNMRLCVRAEDKIREMTQLMKAEVLKVLPELENKLVPNCQYLLYCPEGKKSCGAYPTRKQRLEEIKNKG